jgi:hypothetical protein
MPVTLTITNPTAAGGCTMQIGALPSGATDTQIQYSSRLDMKYVPAWSFSLGTSTAATAIAGFNQSSTVYARARAKLSTGLWDTWSTVQAVYFPLGTAQTFPVGGLQIAPALIVVPHAVLAWSATSEIAGYPARALGRDDPGSMWMGSLSGGAISIIMQVPPSPVDFLALLESNVPEGMTATVYADNTLAGVQGSTPAFTYAAGQARPSANVPGRRAYHAMIRLPVAQSYPFWRLTLTGTCPGGVLGATYACIGKAKSTRSLSAGKTENVADGGSLSRDRSGNANRTLGVRGRSVDFDLSLLTVAEYEQSYSELRNRIGATESAVVVPNSAAGPALHDRILYGVITTSQNTNPYTGKFNQSFSVDSLI